MVIFFTEEDIVSFGNYLLSEDRKINYQNNSGIKEEELDTTLKTVNSFDLENWAYLRTQQINNNE